MRIVNLMENTEGAEGCLFAHGLSFYVETARHKLLLDLGPSEETLENAKTLGIDLTQVDTVILSHGHYDHSGGILPFAGVNPHAPIYAQRTAGEDYYADDGESAGGERYRYIGIDRRICELPQLRLLDGDHRIDEELSLFTVRNRTHALPFTNKRLLKMENGVPVRDEFRHEQYLVVREKERSVLLSGCAHNGILSILDAYREKYGGCPDVAVSGFHLMKKTPYKEAQVREIREMAEELKEYPTVFYTCHCTGEDAFGIMKEVMGTQLRYVHSGEEVPVRNA